MQSSTPVCHSAPRADAAMERSDALAELGVQIPSPNPRSFARIGLRNFLRRMGIKGLMTGRVTRLLALAGMLAALAVPASAAAAPTVSTGAATNVAQTTATLTGTVNPRGAQTAYHFEYGTTKSYGSRTPDQTAGSGNGNVSASTPISQLAPGTTYHYRLVAVGAGQTNGGDKAFTTSKVPNGLSIVAAPTVVKFVGTTIVAGQLTGTGNANVKVTLQARGFPFSSSFGNVGNAQVTDGNGSYRFTVSPLLLATQFRVVASTKPAATSPIVSVGVRVIVTVHLTTAHPRHGHRYRIFGSVQPPHPGGLVSIQRKTATGRWVVVKRTVVRARNSSRSVYSAHLNASHSRTLRVFVRPGDGDHLSGVSAETHVSVR